MAECAQVEPLLSAHADGELDAAAEGVVLAHLRDCAACADEVEQLTVVRSLLRSLPVRRVPEALLPGGRAQGRPDRTGGAPDEGDAAERATGPRLARVGAGVAVAVGLLTGAAFGLGGQPSAGTPVVEVPVDVYVADHFVHTVNRAVSAPVLLELQR